MFLNQHPEIFKLISIKDISLLSNLDEKINIIKHGKFKYYKMFDIDLDDIKNFINNLDNDKIYTVIPFISFNARYDEPYTVLSQQILVTKQSNSILIGNYIQDKTNIFHEQCDIDSLKSYYTIFKYKSIEINFQSYKKFS